MYICNENHPLYDQYKTDFETFSYSVTSDLVFKKKFYNYFGTGQYNHFSNINNNNQTIKNISQNMVCSYLQSLHFVLHYYNSKIPSYTWHYPFRIAPLFSDVAAILRMKNVNSKLFCSFEKGKVFTPFQQLVLILPSESKQILPKPYHFIFDKYRHLYPSTFRVDVVCGMKYIYSEAILPPITNIKNILFDTKKLESQLSKEEKERNKRFL